MEESIMARKMNRVWGWEWWIWVAVCGLLLMDPMRADRGTFDYGGYLETRTALWMGGDTTLLTDVENLRLEGSWRWQKIAWETHLILTSQLQPIDPFYTIRENSLIGYLYDDLIGSFSSLAGNLPLDDSLMVVVLEPYLGHLAYSSFYPQSSWQLDRAAVSLYGRSLTLTIGKQSIGWGTGYAFNPTDIWNRKDPLDVDAPKLGAHALRLIWSLGALTSLDLAVSPGKDWLHSIYGARYKGNWQRFDYSFSFVHYHSSDRALFNLPEKLILGFDGAGEVWKRGLAFEGAWHAPLTSRRTFEDSAVYFQGVIGTDYTFDSGISYLVEYYYNGNGKKNSNLYQALDLLKLMADEMPGLGRHYLMAGLRYTLFTDYEMALFTLTNLSDRSAALMPSIEYRFQDDFIISLHGVLAVGDKRRTEFASQRHTVYGKATAYF